MYITLYKLKVTLNKNLLNMSNFWYHLNLWKGHTNVLWLVCLKLLSLAFYVNSKEVIFVVMVTLAMAYYPPPLHPSIPSTFLLQCTYYLLSSKVKRCRSAGKNIACVEKKQKQEKKSFVDLEIEADDMGER